MFGMFCTSLNIVIIQILDIVSIFLLDLQWSQEKIKTMLMQNFGGKTKSIMVFLKVAY